MVPGLAPWAKAGIIIKQGTRQGSAYAAMMVTGSHGVRMQYNFTGDTAGMPGAVSAAHPRWLRLTRSGDTITGYDSADGTHWTQVGTVAADRAAVDRPGRHVRYLAGLHGDPELVRRRQQQRRPGPGHRSLRSRQPGRRGTRRHLDRHRDRRRRPGRRRAGPGGGGSVPFTRNAGRFTRDGLWRHRARHAGAGQPVPDGDDRAEPGRRVPGADRDRGGGGDVLQHRVPARPHPHHAGRHPAPRRGAGRQGRGDRRGGVRHRARGRGGLDRRRRPEGGAIRVRYC